MKKFKKNKTLDISTITTINEKNKNNKTLNIPT